FERHNPPLIAHGQHIKANVLAGHVITLIDDYGTAATTTPLDRKPEKPVSQPEPVHRCTGCHTEYSKRYGDPLGNIAVGIPFDKLPDGWYCPTCEAPRTSFSPVTRAIA
ncbi:MAG: rubredoxin, partial [Candidatus Hydrogenedentes bacterium]|nr:rubredoxin [Candidatus Hydrogenedentota bacterium]